MPRAVMEGSRLRRPFGGFRRRGRCPVGTPMPSGSGGGAVRVHSAMDGKDAPASSRRMPAPACPPPDVCSSGSSRAVPSGRASVGR